MDEKLQKHNPGGEEPFGECAMEGGCDECLGVWKKEGFERIDWGG